MYDDFDRCYRAVQSRDCRFDGWFVTAVLTTGIYCRPSCPVRLPLARNVRFYPTAAAAQRSASGPASAAARRLTRLAGWNIRSDAVARAMRLIADGVVDRDGVTGLAARVGYTTRQLERMLQAEVGPVPLALARAQRVQTARVLIETTDLPFSDIAFAAGFASIRQFNDTVRSACDSTPTTLRQKASQRQWHDPSPAPRCWRCDCRCAPRSPTRGVRPPGRQRRAGVRGSPRWCLPAYPAAAVNGYGIVSLTPRPDHVSATLVLEDVRDLATAIARCRRLLDLDADPRQSSTR